MDKARLAEDANAGSFVDFQFNPESIEFTKTAKWETQESQTAENAPEAHFTGTGPTELSLKMLLDDTEPPETSSTETVQQRVKRLVQWTCPTEDSQNTSSSAPPLLTFKWGRLQFGVEDRFVGYLNSVGVKYTLFLSTGEPVRADIDIKLSATRKDTPGQNPTSGGIRPWRSRVLGRGDSLAGIAHQEYGDPKHWRTLAELNQLDNPFKVHPGQRVLLPMMIDLEHGHGR